MFHLYFLKTVTRPKQIFNTGSSKVGFLQNTQRVNNNKLNHSFFTDTIIHFENLNNNTNIMYIMKLLFHNYNISVMLVSMSARCPQLPQLDSKSSSLL